MEDSLAPQGSTKLRSWSFNCKGAAQSSEYIINSIIDRRLSYAFLSETWVKPGQDDSLFYIFPESSIGERQIFFKNGMDAAASSYTGRPYGGIAFICCKNDNVSYQEIECSSKRVIALKVLSKDNIHVSTIVGVYMPYFDKSNFDQTHEYIEALDAIQIVIDTYGPVGPIKFEGDWNAQLPMRNEIRPNWYKAKGFNAHSKILYDFVTSNELDCQDMLFNQNPNYTHFQYANNIYTWIDHVFTTKHPCMSVEYCQIIDHEMDNVSDHLPVFTSFSIMGGDNSSNLTSSSTGGSFYSRPNWDNYSVRDQYRDLVNRHVSDLPAFDISCEPPGSLEAQQKLNSYIDSLSKCFLISASEVSHGPSFKQYRPRHFWCPTLTDLRDRKRFWWKLWCDNGRPRSGQVYEVWKLCKKAFRRFFRSKSCEIYHMRFSKLNSLFIQGKPFWNLLKVKNRQAATLNNDIDGFTSHFSRIMREEGDLTPEQYQISETVNQRYNENRYNLIDFPLDSFMLRRHINNLKKRSAPGKDGITTEHLVYADTDNVLSRLVQIYLAIFSHNLVPQVLRVGVIIPILKKPTLDVSDFNNYRPITLCSVFAKLLELIILPESEICDGQYGYRKNKGTDFCSAMINDLVSVFNSQGSPVYICSLDAEKCFDSIWHDGLLYKLMPVMPMAHWRLLFSWYKSLSALVRINGTDGPTFEISKGTRQGSILSPFIFNIFLNDLLLELEACECGLRVGKSKFNSLAYADDIDLFAPNTCDLQTLVNICYNYSKRWRFNFGVKKSVFFIAGPITFLENPSINLGESALKLSESMEVLGKTYTSDGRSETHIFNRIQKSRKALYSIGFNNEELCPAIKAHLWKSIGLSSLLSGVCTGPISKGELGILESYQGKMIKSSLYLDKRAHHSNILHSLGIRTISDQINLQRVNLLRRVFKAPVSSYSKLCAELIAMYVNSGAVPKNTLVGQVVELGLCPIATGFSTSRIEIPTTSNDMINEGLRDSIKYVLSQHIRPGNQPHTLLRRLTQSFQV